MRGAILAVFTALPAICALIAMLSVLPGCEAWQKHMRERHAIDDCIVGIIRDPVLKAQSDTLGGGRIGGAGVRERVCKASVATLGVYASHRENVTLVLGALMMQHNTEQQGW